VKGNKQSHRLQTGWLFLLLLITEVAIAVFVHDRIVRPYVGDVLVTVLLCSLCRVLIPTGVKALPGYVFLFAAAVEIGQYFDIVKLLGLDGNGFLSVLLGRTFSAMDLCCYAVGCLVFFFVEILLQKQIKEK